MPLLRPESFELFFLKESFGLFDLSNTGLPVDIGALWDTGTCSTSDV
jgi:hypothetical protein